MIKNDDHTRSSIIAKMTDRSGMIIKIDDVRSSKIVNFDDLENHFWSGHDLTGVNFGLNPWAVCDFRAQLQDCLRSSHFALFTITIENLKGPRQTWHVSGTCWSLRDNNIYCKFSAIRTRRVGEIDYGKRFHEIEDFTRNHEIDSRLRFRRWY